MTVRMWLNRAMTGIVDAGCAFFTIVVSFTLCVLFISLIIHAWKTWHPIVNIAITIGLLCGIGLEFMYFSLMRRVYDAKTKPMLLAIPLSQPCFPVWLRPVVALFWAVHFLGMVALVFMMYWKNEFKGISALVMAQLLTSLLLYTAFSYCLMALTAFTRNADLIKRIWGNKFRISLGVSFLIYLIPLAKRMVAGH